MVRRIENYSELWKQADWKQFQKGLFRLQCRIWKAVRTGDMAQARNIQKLILRSHSARMLAIRQVTPQGGVCSPLLANIALNGIEDLGKSVRYADDMVFILKPNEDAGKLLEKIETFLAERGMKISEKKTKLTATKDGFDFLGWHFKVQSNGKFKITPSEENFKAFQQKVKKVVNSSNYGATEKADKLAPIVRGWRNYHRYCDMSSSRNSLWFMDHRAFKVFNKEKKQTKYSAEALVKKAFPQVGYKESKFIPVKGDKSPYDGDVIYWSQRNSRLYNGSTAKALKSQNHSCGRCKLKFIPGERIHLHHCDGNHGNWNKNNLLAIHESCHDYIHMGKSKS